MVNAKCKVSHPVVTAKLKKGFPRSSRNNLVSDLHTTPPQYNQWTSFRNGGFSVRKGNNCRFLHPVIISPSRKYFFLLLKF